MKKALVGAALFLAISAGILWLNKRNLTANVPAITEASSQTNTPRSAEPVKSGGGRERFVTEILPTTHDFLRRIESVGITLPFRLPIDEKDVTKSRFLGGPSNTICAFVVGGHTALGYHYVKRDGKEFRGLHSFNRTGRDENEMPLNLDQLKADPVGNERYVRLLADVSQYPPRSLEQTADIAQNALAALRPEDASSYTLTESWQEQIGTNSLPFYAFAFPKKMARSTDPSNVMRDEVVIIFKSTSSGLVLDYFSDTSVAFAGQKPKSR